MSKNNLGIEKISKGRLTRVRVFGGWMVQNTCSTKDSVSGVRSTSTAAIFVPDPLHEWIPGEHEFPETVEEKA